jgi:genetic interactor of prohibitins 3, mitochondrial
MSGRGERDEKYEREEQIDPEWPTVEIFSPGGKFIGVRRPMNAWLNFARKPSENNLKARPRRSMKGMKKLAKLRARASASV